MAIFFKPVFFFCVLVYLVFSAVAQTCRTHVFSNNQTYNACIDLPVLNSFLHWNFYPANRTVNLAYRHINASTSSWIAWAINPTGSGMIGSQALVAFQSDGIMNVYTSPVTDYDTNLEPGNISFPVLALSAEYSNTEMVIFSTLVLPQGNSTNFMQAWQNALVNGNAPQAHSFSDDHLNSTGNIDFLSP